jgi:hypothetical protein
MGFEREDRYIVFKKKDLGAQLMCALLKIRELVNEGRTSAGKPDLVCLVIESDWPEFEQAWEEIRRRMEGRPTIMDEELGRWQQAIYEQIQKLAPGANIDGGGCDSGDSLDLTLTEIAQGFNYWDNLLFETMEAVSHSNIEGSTFRAAADLIKKLAAENEELAQKSCSECSPDNYGWIFNRVEGRTACGCMTEAEPFQILRKALEEIVACGERDSNFPQDGRMYDIAKEALKSVLPLDYAEGTRE